MVIFVVKIFLLTKYFRALKLWSFEHIDIYYLLVNFGKNDENHPPSLRNTPNDNI